MIPNLQVAPLLKQPRVGTCALTFLLPLLPSSSVCCRISGTPQARSSPPNHLRSRPRPPALRHIPSLNLHASQHRLTLLSQGLSPSTLFGPMAHVDSQKFHEVMTCFYIAAQSAGNAEAGAVFEKCMYAIASALPSAPPGGMHMPTFQLLNAQLPCLPAPSPSQALNSHAIAGEADADEQPCSPHTPSTTSSDRGSAAQGGQARGGLAGGRGRGSAAADRVAPAISPSCFPEYKGSDSKRVSAALRMRFPHASIQILPKGQKLLGVDMNRIAIIVDSRGEVAIAPKVG